MVINGGFDYDHDNKVDPSEYEAAAYYYTGNTYKLKMMPAIIDTREYWPTEMGSHWEYEHWQYPTRLTWLDIVPPRVAGSNPDVYFSKNHKDTYWNNGGRSFCRMPLYWSGSRLTASSTSDWYAYFDNNPDGTHYGATSLGSAQPSEILLEAWYCMDESYGQPYQIFPISLNIDSFTINYTQTYHERWYSWPAGTYTDTNRTGGWEISYEWFYIKTDIGYEGPALRLQIGRMNDRVIAGEPLYSIHEEWYFVKDLGMVRIEQYDTNGALTIRVNSSKTLIKN